MPKMSHCECRTKYYGVHLGEPDIAATPFKDNPLMVHRCVCQPTQDMYKLRRALGYSEHTRAISSPPESPNIAVSTATQST
jgi:hypothetical protein